ncbi:unnamed protein product, partial [Rotaria sordida]
MATITINSCLIGKTSKSPILSGLQQAKTYNDTVPPDCRRSVQHDEYYVQFIRK